MPLLTAKQKQELNEAILEYLKLNGYPESATCFEREAEVSTPAPQPQQQQQQPQQPANILEKKWLSVIRLQLKLVETEERVVALQQQLRAAEAALTAGGGHSPTPSPRPAPAVSPRPATSVESCVPRAPEKAALAGHKAPATCVQFHPVFNELVSGCEDGTMRVWDCELARFEETIRGHTNSVNGVDFKPGDGALLASCSSDMTIKLWNFGVQQQAASGQQRNCQRTLVGHDHTVSSVRFTPKGDSLVSASRDGTVKVWDAESGYCTRTLSGHDGWVRAAVVSPDGLLLATAGHDKTVRLWSLANGEALSVFSGHENVVECVAFAMRNGQPVVVSGSRDKTIRLWSVATRSCEAVLEGHGNWVRSILAAPRNPRFLISVGDDRSLLAWDLDDSRCIKTIKDAHGSFVVSVAHCAVHDHYATAGVDALVKLWSTTL